MNIIVDGKVVHAGTGGRDLSHDRPLLVFLHGAGMNCTVWQLQVRYFASHGFSVLALDLPGHGQSEGPPPDSISGYAQWLGEVLHEIGKGPAHVVGTSMGAQIAWHLAGTQPDRVHSLGLLGFAERMIVNRDLLTAAADDNHLACELMASWGLSRSSHKGGHPTPGLWMSGATMRLLERCPPGVLADDLEACRQYDALPLAAAIDVPTLFLLGERDLMVPPRGATRLEAAVEESKTVIVPGVGHVMMIEKPDVVIDEFAVFFGDVVTAE